jgi:hypothetical protein
MLKLKWFLLIPAEIIMNVLALILAPVLSLVSVLFRVEWLPSWLWWFQTIDNDLDGDSGWHTAHFTNLESTSYGFKRWLKRTLWLMRNRAYGFADSVSGVKIVVGDVIQVKGNPDITNSGGVAGSFYAEAFSSGSDTPKAWCYMLVWNWGLGRCLRIYLGWKLQNWVHNSGTVIDGGEAIYVVFFNPFMKFN